MLYSGKRVLVFNPYVTFPPYYLWDSSIVRALRLRGARAEYMVCDALLPECAVYRPAFNGPRPADGCQACRQEVTERLDALRLEPLWMGRFVTEEERAAASRWAAELPTEELVTATSGAWRLGEWVRSALNTHFRTTRFDFGNAQVVSAYRGYLASALIAARALSRYCEEERPDALLIFNGRLDVTRVALEIAKERGIRAVCHEATYPRDAHGLWVNEPCSSIAAYEPHWRAWRDVPLRREQIAQVRSYFQGRETGQDVWLRYTRPASEDEALDRRLGISASRPLWVLFTSSEDELVSCEGWQSCFGDQMTWIRETVDFAAAHPEIDLVLRIHPNTAGRRALGSNMHQLDDFLHLKEQLPKNVRLVLPDDEVSSYRLMDLATVGLTFQSTAGLETAARGKPVLVASECAYHTCPGVIFVRERASYAEHLKNLLSTATGKRDPFIQRQVYRYAFHLFFDHSVPRSWMRVEVRDGGTVVTDFPGQLLPGGNADVERIIRVLLDGETVAQLPTWLDAFISDRAECEAFGLSSEPLERFPLDSSRPYLVLHHSDWQSNAWRLVLREWLRCPPEDATLVLWLDPAQGLSQEAMLALLQEELEASGRPETAWPDLLLVPQELELPDLARLYDSVDAVMTGGDALCALLAEAREVPVLESLGPNGLTPLMPLRALT